MSNIFLTKWFVPIFPECSFLDFFQAVPVHHLIKMALKYYLSQLLFTYWKKICKKKDIERGGACVTTNRKLGEAPL